MNRNILTREDLMLSGIGFALACKFSREWDSALDDALRVYGDHGPFISGCGRDHFPESVKDSLRELARKVTAASDGAYASRPRGVRVETIRKLGRAVAKRDGSGFYGPRA